MTTCPVCHLPLDPQVPTAEDGRRHWECARHADEAVIARPCARCGSWTSQRTVDTEPPTCSHCLNATYAAEAEAQMAVMPAPEPAAARPTPPTYAVATGNGTSASDRIMDWAHE